MAISSATITVRPKRRNRGSVAQFQAELRKMAADIQTRIVPEAVTELVLEIRNRAEQNTRERLGTAPGPPTAADCWWAGPLRAREMSTSSPMPGSDQSSRALMRFWKLGQKLYVWCSAFYAYFHEVGYYEKAGGTRPKNMLRDAVLAVDGQTRRA